MSDSVPLNLIVWTRSRPVAASAAVDIGGMVLGHHVYKLLKEMQ